MNYEDNPLFKLSNLYYNTVESRFGDTRGFTRPGMLIVRAGLLISGSYKDGNYRLETRNRPVHLNNYRDFIHLTRKEYGMICDHINSIEDDSVVYDLGAYHGLHTILGSTGSKVYSFEPDPENIAILKKNIEINSNIRLVEKAVWDKEKELKTNQDGPGSSIGSEGTTIKATTLDDFVEKKEVAPPDVIKIDVEGAEQKVLQGAKKVIQNHKPKIFLELHNEDELSRFGGTKNKVESLLEDVGYEKEKSENAHIEHQTWKSKTKETLK